MKRFLLLSIFAILSIGFKAEKWGLNVEAGYLNNHFRGADCESKGKNGFDIGANVNYNIFKGLNFETGIHYQQKGGALSGRISQQSHLAGYDVKRAEYLTFPLLAGYKFGIGDKFSVIPQLGGYLSTAVGGYAFLDGISQDGNGAPFTARTDLFNPEPISSLNKKCAEKYKRFDGGLMFGVSGKYRNILLKVYYQLGLKDVSPYGNGVNNSTIGVSLGYSFF